MLGKPDGNNSELFFVFYFSEVHSKLFVFSSLAIVLAGTKVRTKINVYVDRFWRVRSYIWAKGVDISLAVWQPWRHVKSLSFIFKLLFNTVRH